MFRTLLIKEMHDTFISRRFIATTLLLIVLIPIGLMVSLDDYRARFDAYQDAVHTYLESGDGRFDSEGRIISNSMFRAEMFRPPSPLSVFVTGIEPLMPNRAVTVRAGILNTSIPDYTGMVSVTNETTLDNPLSTLFGKMDFLFNLSIILTVLAFVFTFSMITGEKEQGTLKQIAANPVDRWKVLVAKILGNFLLFILPFLVSVLLGVILLNLSGTVSIADTAFRDGAVMIITVSLLFLFCMFALGTMISASCHHSRSAILILFFIWVSSAFLIPRLAPLCVQKILPVTGKEVVERQINAIKADLSRENVTREMELQAQVLASFGVTQQEFSAMDIRNNRVVFRMPEKERGAILDAIQETVVPMREEYAERIATEAGLLIQGYENERAHQQKLIQLLSRLSPVSCLTYILTAVASTGPAEADHFIREAERFQEGFVRDMYDLYYNPFSDRKDERNSTPVPQMTDYRHASLAEAFDETWVDFLLLGLYTVLFFAGAFVKFLKYDVR